MQSLSLVIPVHDEEGVIADVVKNAEAALQSCCETYEIIVVNDGSTDGTKSVLEGLNVRAIHHERNRGYGAALKSGFDAAEKEYLCFIDGDGQIDTSDIPRLAELAAENTIVMGVREKRSDNIFRHLLSKGYTNFFTPLCFGISVQDMNAALKIFPRRLIEEIELISDSALINAELLAKAKQLSYRFIEIPINHLPRTTGKPSGGSFKTIFQSLIETNEVRRSLKA